MFWVVEWFSYLFPTPWLRAREYTLINFLSPFVFNKLGISSLQYVFDETFWRVVNMSSSKLLQSKGKGLLKLLQEYSKGDVKRFLHLIFDKTIVPDNNIVNDYIVFVAALSLNEWAVRFHFHKTVRLKYKLVQTLKEYKGIVLHVPQRAMLGMPT